MNFEISVVLPQCEDAEVDVIKKIKDVSYSSTEVPRILDFALALDEPSCFQEFNLSYKCYEEPLRIGDSLTHASEEADCSGFIEL